MRGRGREEVASATGAARLPSTTLGSSPSVPYLMRALPPRLIDEYSTGEDGCIAHVGAATHSATCG